MYLIDFDSLSLVIDILNSRGFDVYYDEYENELVIDGDEEDVMKAWYYIKLAGLGIDEVDTYDHEEKEIEYDEEQEDDETKLPARFD